MKQRALIRWTIGGNVSADGLEILGVSISFMKKIYGDIADFMICYNNIKEESLSRFEVPLFKQYHDPWNFHEYEPTAEMWKMYPPRLRYEAHEIVMDNDLIIFKKFDMLDEFFCGNHTLLLQGRERNYGSYDHLVPQPYAINSGFYGLPPNFDFGTGIEMACLTDSTRKWTKWCDDQGVIAHALMREENFKIVSPNDILNYFPMDEYSLPENISGIHFIGSNRGLRANWQDVSKSLLRKYSSSHIL